MIDIIPECYFLLFKCIYCCAVVKMGSFRAAHLYRVVCALSCRWQHAAYNSRPLRMRGKQC